MKTFISLLLLLASLSAFAQDLYHTEFAVECLAGESCLINQRADFLIKTVPVEDYDGVIVGERLSSSSNIADTLHPKAEYCFQGEAGKICNILNLMAYDDGHMMITAFACQVVNNKVAVRYTVDYDMGPAEQLAFLLKKCE